MIRTEKLPFIQSWPAKGVIVLTLCVMATGIALPNIPWLADNFGFVKLPKLYYAYLVVAVLCYMLLSQVVKMLCLRYVKTLKEWL